MENKIFQGGSKMKANSKTKKSGARKITSPRAKGNVHKDHAQSQSTEKLEKVLTNVVNQIAEKEIGKGDEATVSPTILKKGKKKATTKKGKGKVKAKSKKQNGQRAEERKVQLQAYAKSHGTMIKRMYTKHSKIRPIVIKLKAEGLKESDVYQVANMLGIIKTNTAQKKLKRLGLVK